MRVIPADAGICRRQKSETQRTKPPLIDHSGGGQNPSGHKGVYYVYIMASKRNGTLYIGVTSDLAKRVYEHKNDFVDGFTKRYGVHTLVYYEVGESQDGSLWREKNLKSWRRRWKIRLIESVNPEWRDLYEEIL